MLWRLGSHLSSVFRCSRPLEALWGNGWLRGPEECMRRAFVWKITEVGVLLLTMTELSSNEQQNGHVSQEIAITAPRSSTEMAVRDRIKSPASG